MLSLYIILTVIKGIRYGITEVFNEKILKKWLFINKMIECTCLCYVMEHVIMYRRSVFMQHTEVVDSV